MGDERRRQRRPAAPAGPQRSGGRRGPSFLGAKRPRGMAEGQGKKVGHEPLRRTPPTPRSPRSGRPAGHGQRKDGKAPAEHAAVLWYPHLGPSAIVLWDASIRKSRPTTGRVRGIAAAESKGMTRWKAIARRGRACPHSLNCQSAFYPRADSVRRFSRERSRQGVAASFSDSSSPPRCVEHRPPFGDKRTALCELYHQKKKVPDNARTFRLATWPWRAL